MKEYHIVVLICISLIISNGELWVEVHDIVQETGIKTIEKKCKKSKMAVCGGLTNSCAKKRSEKQRRKGKI